MMNNVEMSPHGARGFNRNDFFRRTIKVGWRESRPQGRNVLLVKLKHNVNIMR